MGRRVFIVIGSIVLGAALFFGGLLWHAHQVEEWERQVEAFVTRGDELASANRMVAAAEEYEKAVRLLPEDGKPPMELGIRIGEVHDKLAKCLAAAVLHGRKDLLDNALLASERAIRLGEVESWQASWTRFGTLVIRKEGVVDGSAYLSRVLSETSETNNGVAGWVFVARLLEAEHGYKQALRMYQHAYSLYGSDYEAARDLMHGFDVMWGLARNLAHCGQPKEALAVYRKIAAWQSDTSSLRVGEGRPSITEFPMGRSEMLCDYAALLADQGDKDLATKVLTHVQAFETRERADKLMQQMWQGRKRIRWSDQ